MISFSDTSLLSSTILDLNENEKETQTSNELIKKSLQTDIPNEYFASLEETYTEINDRLKWNAESRYRKWFNENDKNGSVIIDCFEIFINKQSNLKACSAT